MKKLLLIIIILLGIICSNIVAFAQENESEAYEIPTEENSELSGNSDITDEELESAIIIGSGTEEQINTTFLDEFDVYYFSQLNKNFGNNYIGSCSYTAAAMLLSFYDTYWNDNIIPEHYESQDKNFPNTKLIEDISESPGIIWKYIPRGTTEEQYKTIIDNYKEEYFHLKLIDIGLNLFDDYALFPSSVEELLEHYLYNVAGFTTSEVTVERITAGNLFDGTTVREYVINKVTQGIPVFVSATSLGEGAHSYIIYDYDASTDELYCHLGWYEDTENNKKYTHVAFSTLDYTLFEGAVTINFTQNSQHSHSDNYVDAEGNTYCSCEFACHPEHKHRYRVLEDYEDTHHAYECLCSLDNEPEEHTFIYSKIDDNTHSVSCAFCDYEDIQTHSLIRTNTQDDANHDVYCELCEYTDSLPHNYKCYGTIGPTMHTELCTECGYYHGGVAYPQIISTNETSHALGCDDCGFAVEVVNHNFDYTIVSNSVHEKHCTVCDYTATSSHNYTYDYEQLNASAHYAYCECGARSSFGHNFYQSGDYNICSDCSYKEQTTHTHSYTYLPRAGGRFHLKQCECGDSKLEACLGVSDGNGTSICIACGQTVISGPGIILSDDEEDEELK